jgi:hypothetical protein
MLVAMLGVPPSRKARPRLGLVALAFAFAEALGPIAGLSPRPRARRLGRHGGDVHHAPRSRPGKPGAGRVVATFSDVIAAGLLVSRG